MTAPSAPPFTRLPRLSVAACLLKYLILEDVGLIFGVPGGALTHILRELKDQKQLRYIVCRHETGAVYLADGYARATGKLGVALVTAGPGATNALTGTMNAQNSNTNVLIITGEVPESTWGLGYLQEGIDANLDIDAIYRNSAQYSTVITEPANFQPLFTQALRSALAVPPRAAHVSLPDDVAGECLANAAFPTSAANYRATPRCADVPATEKVLGQLAVAKRPLLLLGNGCRRALADERRRKGLETLATDFALPVMTTPEAKGLFPERHEFALRTYGLAGCTWPLAYLKDRKHHDHYDLLLVAGSSLQQLATNGWNDALLPNGPFIQVDLDQAVIARAFPVTQGIVAEVGVFFDDLIRLRAKGQPDPELVRKRTELVEGIKKNSPYLEPGKRASDDNPMLPQALMRCVNDVLAEHGHEPMLFLDGGNCLGWGYHYLEINPPAEIHSALDMGPMGFGVGAVVGAKLGKPERDCVAIVGDGALLMFGAEISTAAQYEVGAVWVVLFDNDLAMASQGLNYYFPDPGWAHYYKLGNPNLALFARALGADGYDVHSPAEMLWMFPRALRRARKRKRPQVLVAHINRDEMPPYHPVPAPAYVPCDKRP